ncbi:hypothetical protein ABH926_005413 [Catenulispora sp. GP43]|uniref:hypothetical protein n=1 Tax=Catenulispora sp. GP43 TaxID=3156263 RepID=UPI003514B254
MLARTRRVPTLAAAMALGLATATATATAAGSGAAAANAALSVTGATGATGAATPFAITAAPQITTLPNGDRVLVTGSGPHAATVVLGPDGRSVPATRFAPNPQHAYVIPDSVVSSPGQFVASQYEIPALSSGSTPAVTPHYAMGILQINGVGLDGAAAYGLTYLANVDDVTRWSAPLQLFNGVGRAAVPAGHYNVITQFSSYDPTTNFTKTYQVTQLGVTVGTTGTTTVTADQRTATSQVQVTTPRPADLQTNFLFFKSTDVNGDFSFLLPNTDGPGAAYVNPTAKAQFGTFSYQMAGWTATSPAGTADPYRYDVMFPATDHIDADQTYKVDPSTLTTVHNTFVSDPSNTAHTGLFMTGPFVPTFGSADAGGTITSPGSLTEYVSAASGLNWGRTVATNFSASSGGPGLAMLNMKAEDLPYAGHTDTWRTWGRGPLTPQVGQYKSSTFCRACADGGTVDLSLNMYQDSSPDTEGEPEGPIGRHFTAYRDGNQVFSQDYTSGTELTGQAQTPGTYRFVYDQDLSQFPISQSTVTHTDVTVPYTPTPDPKWTLPSDDTCNAQAGSTTPCSILPVLDLNYQLASDDMNTTHGPLTVLNLNVGHQSYEGAGSQAAIKGATVSVSFDKGATWTAATVIPAGSGHYVAMWPNGGAKGSTPWLKVTASDALGGSITQTVDNAYTIG